MSEEMMGLPGLTGYNNKNAFDGRCIRFNIGPVVVWYSYETVVAFKVNGFDRVVAHNRWSRTTGKHLNSIDGGGNGIVTHRVDDAEFIALWNQQVAPIILTAELAAEKKVETVGYRRRIDRGYRKQKHAEIQKTDSRTLQRS